MQNNMEEKKFNKEKVKKAIALVETIHSHCKNHREDCPIIKCIKILEGV